MTKLDKKSQKDFLEGLEKLVVILHKKNNKLSPAIIFAELLEMFLYIIFGYFEKNNIENQFVPCVMASTSNFISDNAPQLIKENDGV